MSRHRRKIKKSRKEKNLLNRVADTLKSVNISKKSSLDKSNGDSNVLAALNLTLISYPKSKSAES